MSGHQQLIRRMHRKRVAHDDHLVVRIPGPDPTSSKAEGTPAAPNTNTVAAGTSISKGPVVRTSATPTPTAPATPAATSSQDLTSQNTNGNTSVRNTSAVRNTASGATAEPSSDNNTDTDTGVTGSSNTRSQAQNSRSAASGSLTPPVFSSSGAHTSFTSSTLSSAEPSATADEPKSNAGSTNAAGVIGGIVAFIVGVVVLTFAVRKLVSLKKRHRNEEPDEFNANEFRRSAVLIDDPPSHSDTVSRGYNPRPLTMLERKLNRSPTFVRQGYGEGTYDNFNDFPPLPPQQPSYPEPAYISPVANPTTAGLGSPFDSTFDSANQNPYVTQQAAAGAAGVGAYGADYVPVNPSSHVSSPVVASFESPAFFAPMNTDNEPLYSPSHRQEFDRPAVMERASEEYVRAAAVNGYTLP